MFPKGLFHWSSITTVLNLVLTIFTNECDCRAGNLVLGKRTFTSSFVGIHHGRFAVDDIIDSYVHVDDRNGDPWFVVDLGRPYPIHRIFLIPKDGNKFVVVLLNDFDLKMKTNKIKDSKFCKYEREFEFESKKRIIFGCGLSTNFFRYVMVKPGVGRNDLVLHELKVEGIDFDYYGCYKKLDSVTNARVYEENLTLCLVTCTVQNKTYAAFKQKKCVCALDVSGLRPLNECNKLCLNNIDYCGGQNAYSVYNVNESQRLDHHCKHGIPLNFERVCENNKCENGWTGESCSMRDCSIHNGGCQHHTCTQVKLASGMTGECICNEGYFKSFWWESCEDVDECTNNVTFCNIEVSNCSNTNGSYECICLDEGMLYDSTSYSCYRSSKYFQLKSTIVILIPILLTAIIISLALKSFLASRSTAFSGNSFDESNTGTFYTTDSPGRRTVYYQDHRNPSIIRGK